MATAAVGKKSSAADCRARSGRPPKESAGEVEGRILDAARQVFLERGYEGASIEEIAERARAGKPTIYARYGNKRELFAAAFAQHIAVKSERIRSQTLAGATVEERLKSIAAALLRETLTAESIGLFRLAIAEARQFPDFASSIIGTARERGIETVAQLMIEAAEAGEFQGLTPVERDRWVKAAVPYFVDLILLPLVMLALSGVGVEELREGIGAHVADRVPFFLAACCNGGIRRPD
jgi:AcrR family transcriptional regulator